jgi:hypothetical protein
MTWNYRVIRHDDGQLAIHEVHYDQYGAADMVTATPVGIWGDDIQGVRRHIARFVTATMKPILDYEQFKAGERNRGEA